MNEKNIKILSLAFKAVVFTDNLENWAGFVADNCRVLAKLNGKWEFYDKFTYNKGRLQHFNFITTDERNVINSLSDKNFFDEYYKTDWYHGICNFAVSCFINSMIQLCTTVKPFLFRLFSCTIENDIIKTLKYIFYWLNQKNDKRNEILQCVRFLLVELDFGVEEQSDCAEVIFLSFIVRYSSEEDEEI